MGCYSYLACIYLYMKLRSNKMLFSAPHNFIPHAPSNPAVYGNFDCFVEQPL